MKKQIILFTTLLLAFCSGLMIAQIPRTLSYQGVLTDSLGNPKPDGVQTFTFRLYDVESGGAALWTEIKDLQVKRGLFTTILGDITSFPPTVIFDKPYWLGIKPGAEPELSPRIPFSSVAYSLNSLKSDTAAYARVAPQAGYVDSARIAGTVPDNSITNSKLVDGSVATAKILDGTIQRVDVAPGFTAPYSDTAAYARVAPQAGYVDSARIAGTIPNNTITTDKILDGTIQRIDVISNFTAPKADTATVALTALSSAPTGTAGGDLSGTYPNPTIANNTITSVKIADGSVTSTKIVDATITGIDIANSTIGAEKLNFIPGTGTVTNVATGSGLTGGPITTTGTISIPTDGVTTAMILDGTIATADIADNSVTSSKIVDGTIIGSDISTTAMLNITSLTTSGDVGVGTTNPTAPLHVTGNPSSAIVHFVNTAERVLINTVGNGAFPGLYINNNSVNVAGRDIRFQIGNQSMLTVANSGAVGIGTTDPAQKLDVAGTAQVAGFKMPTGAADGHVLTSNTSGVGTWQAAASGWNLIGNAGTIAGTNFVGTTDAQAFDIRTNNLLRTRITTKGQIETYNTGQSVFLGEGAGANDDLTNNRNVFVGYQTGYSNTTGDNNTANGWWALYSNITGSSNTANGLQALYSNTTGSENTANGNATLYYNTTGVGNTANGVLALVSNTTGNYNTANGTNALYSNVAGSNATAIGNNAMLYANNTSTPFTNYNVAVGFEALRGSTTASANTGNWNTALGYQTLYSNTTGNYNTANGYLSLYSNTTGYNNTANGRSALYYNTTGYYNTANGDRALYSNTTGYVNTANGMHALYSNTTGNYNTALGFTAGSNVITGSNLTLIGYNAEPTSPSATNQITLGNSDVTSLRCAVTTITALSDARDKKNIQDLLHGLDFISKLKPRQFNWDKREWYENNISDGSKMQEAPTAGFIAQELDEVQTAQNTEWLNLVLKDNPEKIEATPGNLLPIMVKAIQELRTENVELRAENKELRTKSEELSSRLSELESVVNSLAQEKKTSDKQLIGELK